jgi:hypothetical protein
MATTKPPMSTSTSVGEENAATSESNDPVWRPLLIIIPLRLGLTVINNCYLPAIQVQGVIQHEFSDKKARSLKNAKLLSNAVFCSFLVPSLIFHIF